MNECKEVVEINKKRKRSEAKRNKYDELTEDNFHPNSRKIAPAPAQPTESEKNKKWARVKK